MAAPSPIPASSPLLNPGAPLSGNALLQAAQALSNLQTQAPISDLTRAIATNQQQTQGAINQTGGYFGQLGNQAQQGVNAQGQIAGGLNAQLAGIGTDTQNQLTGIGQNATDSLLKYAPQSDPNHSLANPALQSLTTELARQKGLAAQNSASSRIFGATQGANYGNLAASNLGTFALRGQEALKGIAQAGQLRNQPLTQKLADLKASQGALTATNLGKLRQQEVTNTIARAGLGIKAATASASMTSANASARNASTNALNLRTSR